MRGRAVANKEQPGIRHGGEHNGQNRQKKRRPSGRRFRGQVLLPTAERLTLLCLPGTPGQLVWHLEDIYVFVDLRFCGC